MAWPGHASRSHKGFLVATVAVCILADIVAYAAVIPVLPSLLTEAGAQQKDLQSLTSAIITTHAASSMVFFPMAGLIADFARTRRLSIIVGLAIFTVVSASFDLSSLEMTIVRIGNRGVLSWLFGNCHIDR